MRYIMTAFAALSLGALPITAQVPARPAQPTQPAQPAAPAVQITEQQRQQHQAIREKYAKDFKAHQDAMQALNEKMRTEIEATLTPEQREARQRVGGRGLGLGLGGGRGLGAGMGGGRGVGLGQGGGRVAGMTPGDGQLQRRAMMWNRADRAARQIIGMRNRVALRTMLHQRVPGRMARPGAMGGRAGMMGQMGQGDMTGGMGQGAGLGPMRRGQMMGGTALAQPAPKVVKPAPATKKPPTGGGGN